MWARKMLHEKNCHASTSLLAWATQVIAQSAVARMRLWSTRTQGPCSRVYSIRWVQGWPAQRRHNGYTDVENPCAVPRPRRPGLLPRSLMTVGRTTPGKTMPNELAMSDDSDSGDEALSRQCDDCRGPLYFLPLKGLTECSLCDEPFADLAWCESRRMFICLRHCCEDVTKSSPHLLLTLNSDKKFNVITDSRKVEAGTNDASALLTSCFVSYQGENPCERRAFQC